MSRSVFMPTNIKSAGVIAAGAVLGVGVGIAAHRVSRPAIAAVKKKWNDFKNEEPGYVGDDGTFVPTPVMAAPVG